VEQEYRRLAPDEQYFAGSFSEIGLARAKGYGAFTKWKALKRYKLRTQRSKERLTF
jgi:hypothetical protein